MTIITSIVLGVVEGLTEFLPVSSTGHLILVSHWLALPSSDFLKSFEIIIQLGAIGAIVALYWRKLFINRLILIRLIIAFIPTAIIGLLFYRLIKTYLLGNVSVVLWALGLGGLILIVFELWYRTRQKTETNSLLGVETISYRQAFIIGLSQAFAVVPGVSRSAATIMGGLVLGLRREVIVEFSFLLAAPTMLAATGWDLVQTRATFSLAQTGSLLIGFAVSFLVALLAVKVFLNYIRQHDFVWFGLYRLFLALLVAGGLWLA